MENIFIDALLVACPCQELTGTSFTRRPVHSLPFSYHKARRKNAQNFFKHTRSMQTLQTQPRPLDPMPPFTRNEYVNMLDYYKDPYPSEHTTHTPKPLNSALPQKHAHLSPPLDEDIIATTPEATVSSEEILVERLVSMLNRQDCSHDAIMEAYSKLPYPGVACLPPWTRRQLLHRLSKVEKKNVEGMVRYLAIVEEMKAANLLMTDAEWNSVLAFTGRCHAPVRASELESALQMWGEMERIFPAQGEEIGEVTLNILFDLAAKAEKFVLAEMILKEMRARGLPMNRFARTNLIFYHGLQGDGDAVRNAYKAFVEAGEIVDTVVMNCVIASLILADEPQAAELVYERMRRMYQMASGGSPPSYCGWRRTREIGQVLNRAAQSLRVGSQEHRKLQDQQLLRPDLRTCSIFIEYHVTQTGELRRIVALLEDMRALRIPIHGRIFVKLLKGFARHGGVRYTSWTRPRLERVWTSLLAMLARKGEEGVAEDIHVGKWMVFWAMRAFHQCCGRARALEIWDELSSRWKPGYDEEMAVLNLLEDILLDRHDSSRSRSGSGSGSATVMRTSWDIRRRGRTEMSDGEGEGDDGGCVNIPEQE